MKKKNRILVWGLTFSMVISSGSLTGCDSAAGNMGKETTGVEYEEADYELSEESCSDSGIDHRIAWRPQTDSYRGGQ